MQGNKQHTPTASTCSVLTTKFEVLNGIYDTAGTLKISHDMQHGVR